MGAVTLDARDVRAVLDLAGRCAEQPVQPDGVPGLLAALSLLVPCDTMFWDRFACYPVFTGAHVDGPGEECSTLSFGFQDWLAHLPEHPIMSGRYGPVTAFSDVLGPLELRRSWHYLECMRPNHTAHEIGLELPRRGSQRSIVSFTRRAGRDFDDRDHLVLALLRPHVDAALRRLTAPAPVLTARQVEIMRLVAEGLTNRQIAHRLRLADKTVDKHLENAYARLGARSRVHAVALSEPLLGG